MRSRVHSVRPGIAASAALLALVAVLLPTGASAASLNLAKFRNHVSVCTTPADTCNFDEVGYGYSSSALLLAGVEGGSTVTADGITYTWPDVASGAPDNVTLVNQVIPADGTGATRIGFLGASHHGPVSADVILHYAGTAPDGTPTTVEQTRTITFSDWTLQGGGATPSPGNDIAITMAYRAFAPAIFPTTTHVFAVDLPLDPAMRLTAVELPREKRIRLFDIALA